MATHTQPLRLTGSLSREHQAHKGEDSQCLAARHGGFAVGWFRWCCENSCVLHEQRLLQGLAEKFRKCTQPGLPDFLDVFDRAARQATHNNHFMCFEMMLYMHALADMRGGKRLSTVLGCPVRFQGVY